MDKQEYKDMVREEFAKDDRTRAAARMAGIISRMADIILAPNAGSRYTRQNATTKAESVLAALNEEIVRRKAKLSDGTFEAAALSAAKIYADQTPKSDRTQDIHSAVVAALDRHPEREAGA